jgi:hypothetical protein
VGWAGVDGLVCCTNSRGKEKLWDLGWIQKIEGTWNEVREKEKN